MKSLPINVREGRWYESSQREAYTIYVFSQCFARGKKWCVCTKKIILVITPSNL